MPNTPFQIDYTNKDYEAFRNMMINSIPLYTPEWTDTNESDFGIVLIELLATGLDILSYYQDRALNEAYLPTARLRRSVINLCKLVGYTLQTQTPAKVYVVFTLTAPAPVGGFTIPQGTQVSTQPDATTDPIIFEVDQTITIPQGAYGNETDMSGNYLYQVSVTQGETISNEVLGTSNGNATQQFTLLYSPVIHDSSLQIFVKNSAGLMQQWNEKSDFLSSQPTSQDYTVSIDENGDATITFGSGSSGAIPDTNVYHGLTASYRIGGGTFGNVGSNTITNLISPIAGISSVSNPTVPYQLGTDPEDLDHARELAPVMYRTNMRGVTTQDISDLVVSNFNASKTTPIIKATAIPITTSWNYDVQLYALRSDLAVMSSADKTAIQAYLDTIRMITQKIQILDGQQVSISVSVSVTLLPTFLQSAVKNQVTQALTYLLQTSNFNFGQTVQVATILNTVMAVQGVQNVQMMAPMNDIIMQPSQILKTIDPMNIMVNVTGGVVG